MNKIILKNQLVNDPIFARANPIHQEIALVEQQQFLNDETISFIMGSGAVTSTATATSSMNDTFSSNSGGGQGARRRLFAKKNEKQQLNNNPNNFDPNASTASSTTSSSTNTPVHHNPAFSAFHATPGTFLYPAKLDF